jgi:tetratricopeptide (TPR) repeat protein
MNRFSELGRLYTIMREPEKAVKVYEEALENSNENSDILVILGIISLTQGNEQKAF